MRRRGWKRGSAEEGTTISSAWGPPTQDLPPACGEQGSQRKQNDSSPALKGRSWPGARIVREERMEVFVSQDPRWLSNAWLVAEGRGGAAIVIDTGAPPGPIVAEAERLGARVAWVLNTHFHGDHVAENKALSRRFGAPVAAHRIEIAAIPTASVALEDGQRLSAG